MFNMQGLLSGNLTSICLFFVLKWLLLKMYQPAYNQIKRIYLTYPSERIVCCEF